MTEETNNEQIAEAEAPAQEAPPSLTIQDLENLRNIVDVAAKRGVFKTEEFTMVGETYAKLNNFIIAITPPVTEGEQPAPAPAAE